MAGVRVQKLGLKLVAPHAARADEHDLRRSSETGFMPRVFRAMHKRLEQSFGPDAVIEIATLKFQCRLRQGDMAHEQFADALGADLAVHIESSAKRPVRGKAGQTLRAPIQIYRSQPQRAAVRLIAAINRQKDENGARKTPTGVLGDILKTAPRSLPQIVRELDDLRDIAEVFEKLPAPVLRSLAAEVAGKLPSKILRVLERVLNDSAANASPARPQANDPPATGPDRPTTTPEQPHHDTPRPPATDNDPLSPPEHIRPDTSTESPVEKDAPAEPDAKPDAKPPAIAPRETGPFAGMSKDITEPHAPQDAAQQITPEGTLPDPSDRQTANGPLVLNSEWCGLFYLLNVTNRLGFAEQLWRIGLSEGDVLAAMFGHLSSDDTEGQCLSQAFPRTRAVLPTLQDWAWGELEPALLASPLLEGAKGRITALEVLLRGDAEWSVATWGAAVHIAGSEAMMQTQFTPETIQTTFGLHGQIVIDDETITVIQPVDAINLDLRKAGLDADPGWLPWIKKSLQFTFTAPDDES